MAKKLGKKARKFAKKNLQSVLKRRRKLKAVFKKRSAPRGGNNRDALEGDEKVKLDQNMEGNSGGVILDGSITENDLENVFPEEDEDLNDDISDSDGYLSEDTECPYISESESENDSTKKNAHIDLVGKNKELSTEITQQRKKLNRLIKKDPEFSNFLESRKNDMEISRREELYSDEDEDEDDTSYPDGDAVQDSKGSLSDKILTSSTIDVWCWLVMQEPSGPAVRNLLNGFRVACRYGVDSNKIISKKIQSREVFSKILTFVLSEADNIFRRLLRMSDSGRKENIPKLKSASEWRTVSPLMESYLRSSLYLLHQITDNQILIFVLSRLRASIIFFSAFPSLARRLIKIAVHLWATGDQSLSLSSFTIIRDIASELPSDYLDICLTRTYKSFIVCSKFVEHANLKHIEFLMNSIVELHSLDIRKSSQRVLTSVQQLGSILRKAFKTKKKEELKMIHSWQYINCINMWVKFITCNSRDNDLQPLVFSVIQVITGVAHLFPGLRNIPLRFKCVQMLNELSLSSGVFVPIASLVFECLDYKESGNLDTTRGTKINFSSLLKVPKQLLKSQDFHEECVLSAIELLSAHFAQWSYHISFPELTAIPLILLKRFDAKTTIEGLRRPVRRLIDQVEQNRDFIQRKRDEVSFSPNDQASADSFTQLEKSSGNAPFTQYYASVLQNSRTRIIVN
ncbi:protein REBELOTE [Typha angustifolia]|uniref:protein REBELOTE n=1 Tax=Typha angustifolia TaxID=59011 RepID=UPI003C2F202D